MTTPHKIEVDRTPLPGVGLRIEFSTSEGRRVGVIHLQRGGMELYISDVGDPDRTTACVELAAIEAKTLTEILGGSSFSQELSHLQTAAAAVAVDWLPIGADSPFAAQPLGNTRLRTRTGVSIVAVIRDGAAIPSPTPDFELAVGDVVVAVGTVDALAAAEEILLSGE